MAKVEENYVSSLNPGDIYINTLGLAKGMCFLVIETNSYGSWIFDLSNEEKRFVASETYLEPERFEIHRLGE